LGIFQVSFNPFLAHCVSGLSRAMQRPFVSSWKIKVWKAGQRQTPQQMPNSYLSGGLDVSARQSASRLLFASLSTHLLAIDDGVLARKAVAFSVFNDMSCGHWLAWSAGV
jgi:hypothetical protein